MADTQESLDRWRNFFRAPDHDIFDIIKNAIIVAAYDFPSQLKSKRGLFTEMLYASNDTSSSVSASEITGLNGATKERKDATADHPKEVLMETMNVAVNSTNEDADALCTVDENEIGDELFEEVLSIKKILDNNEEQSNDMLCDSLKKLKEINVSVETLQATKIGKSVNALKKNGSKDVKNLARTLIEDWKNMLNAWIEASKATDEEVTPEPVEPSSKQPVVEVKEEEEQGLPCPPLDEGVFLDTPINMELSQVFNGLDDYGNPLNSKGVSEKQDHDGKFNCEEIKIPPSHKIRIKIKTKSAMQQKIETAVIEKKHVPHQGKRLDNIDETSIEKKLESSKRKLHERYEELEKAKKQKTIQIMEFKDLPKQKHSTNVLHQKPGHRKSLMNRMALRK